MSRIERIRAHVEDIRAEHEAWKASRPAPDKMTDQRMTQNQLERDFYRAKFWAETNHPVTDEEAEHRRAVLAEATAWLAIHKKGFRGGGQKIADPERKAIRKRLEAGETTIALAGQYGVRRQTIGKIRHEYSMELAA